jgi:hypothetical protein
VIANQASGSSNSLPSASESSVFGILFPIDRIVPGTLQAGSRSARPAICKSLQGERSTRYTSASTYRYAGGLPGGPLAIFHGQAADAVIMERRDE